MQFKSSRIYVLLSCSHLYRSKDRGLHGSILCSRPPCREGTSGCLPTRSVVCSEISLLAFLTAQLSNHRTDFYFLLFAKRITKTSTAGWQNRHHYHGLLLGSDQTRRWTASENITDALSPHWRGDIFRCHYMASSASNCGILPGTVSPVRIARQ